MPSIDNTAASGRSTSPSSQAPWTQLASLPSPPRQVSWLHDAWAAMPEGTGRRAKSAAMSTAISCGLALYTLEQAIAFSQSPDYKIFFDFFGKATVTCLSASLTHRLIRECLTGRAVQMGAASVHSGSGQGPIHLGRPLGRPSESRRTIPSLDITPEPNRALPSHFGPIPPTSPGANVRQVPASARSGPLGEMPAEVQDIFSSIIGALGPHLGSGDSATVSLSSFPLHRPGQEGTEHLDPVPPYTTTGTPITAPSAASAPTSTSHNETAASETTTV